MGEAERKIKWRGWHTDDEECCIRLWNAGYTHREIAETLGKTKRQVDNKLKILRKRPDNTLRVFTQAETVAKQAGEWRR
jgi:predicted transcriptional regulator